MKDGPDIARIAALVGDPARANMLSALMDGGALTASELALEAGVTLQTASSHLAKLTEGGLLKLKSQGRHRYYALSGYQVAAMLESISGVAASSGPTRTRPGPRDSSLREARICYDHLAGIHAVDMFESFAARGILEVQDETVSLGPQGHGFFSARGIDIETLGKKSRRPVCRGCLDWSVRRSHLAGTLGAAILDKILTEKWARRIEGSRVISFTPPGKRAFEKTFLPKL
ncbi:ArsR/SmtB family transcription factor [Oryzicola mucosus]|uniref:Helix-turn-helix transcriptional regulator n=1 Tax=Oryzicola mucosus TaxID=2767425 RepID=A0A8J6PVD3_9HYPH|nr:helix-turn-helix transcriptional regulator [Oryzicola mucosus]MBD0414887.1 helix-turn-helix transcriptional regulator [Oryzicola mucosus]